MAYLISSSTGNMCDGVGFSSTTTAGTNYISVPNITQLSGASAMSLSFWAQKTASTSVVSIGKVGSSGNSWGLTRGDGTIRVFCGRNAASVYADYAIANDTNLHHYVVVYDGTQADNASRLKLYIDGSQITFDSFTGTVDTTLTTNTGVLGIGRLAEASTYTTAGTFAQVDIFTSAISGSNVTSLYNSGSGLTDASAITGHLAGWRMREGAGATAFAYGTGITTYNGIYTGTVTRSAGLIYDNNTPRFSLCHAANVLDSRAGTTAVTTSALYSATTSPSAGVVWDGIAVNIATVATSPTGTMTLVLRNNTDSTNERTVTINVADLSRQTGSTTSPGWAFFKFSSSFTTAAKTYSVGLSTSSSSQVTCYTNGTANNWSRLFRTTTTQCPAVSDALIVCGELTGQGTGSDVTITMNNRERIVWGYNTAGGVTPASVSYRGILTAPTSGGKDCYFGVQCHSASQFTVSSGGQLKLGTPASRVAADTTFQLYLFQSANVDCGLVIENGGTYETGDDDGRNAVTYLSSDVSASATSVTVNDATGWRVGDIVIIPSSTRTYSQAESRTITAISTNTITVAALTNAHTAINVDGARLRVLNISSNVQVVGVSTSLSGYVLFNNYPHKIDHSGCHYRYMGSGTTDKRGIDIKCQSSGSGTLTFSGAKLMDFAATSAYGFNTSTSASGVTISSLIAYNIYTGCNIQATTGTLIFTDLYLVTLSSGNGLTIGDVGSTYSGTIYSSCAQSNNVSISETGVAASFTATIETHSGTSSGLSAIAQLRNLNPAAIISWRNSGAGAVFSACHDWNVGVTNMFGNTTDNLLFSGQCSGMSFGAGSISADTTFATTNNIRFSATGTHSRLKLSDIKMSEVSGIRAAATNDINFAAVVSIDAVCNYCLFGSTTEIASPTNMTPGSSICSQYHDQTAGNHKFWLGGGIGTRDTTIKNSGSESLRFTPSTAVFKSLADSRVVAIASGETKTITVKVRESVSGDGTAYNGAFPRLILRANRSLGTDWAADIVLDTATSAAEGSFETLTGTTPTAGADGAFEVYVDCDGTTGWINSDEWRVA